MLKREMLKGYVIDKKEQRTVNGNAFEIITYQGDHCDEYLVREVKSGQCWLFYKGVLRISWKETNEGQIGEWTVHERGKTLSVGSDLKLDEVKEIKCQSYYETMNKSDMYHSYLELYKRDGFRWVREGVVEKSSSVLIQQNVDRMIEVNVELRQLLSVNGEVVRGIEHNQVLNLTDEGERWEGDVLCHQPYGWGVLYDIEGEKVYEGFRIGNESVCYGMQYYADIQKVEYEGEICDGKRWGRGIQYDRNGVVVFDGEWLDNEHEFEKRIVMNDETQCLHSCIEELIVSDKNCNGEEWSVLDLSCMSHLRLLQVGDDCFRNVNEVKLIGLHALERVMIGKNSFTTPVEFWILIRNRHGHFYLKDCPSIRELKIGRNSFRDYSVCEIANVPSLEGIEMGEVNELSFNFCFASLELKRMLIGVRMMTRLAELEVTFVW